VLKNLFESKNMSINISSDIKNIELYWSLKNIMAILSGYYTWKWYSLSTLWKYLSEFYNELKDIIWELWWNKNLNFWDYSLGWDIIATCFWNSRNREFWELLWKGLSLDQAIGKMKEEKKYVEGYEMLKTLYKRIEDKPWFGITKKLYKIVFEK
jgi:glycerol-3-phosphate dehydrogenase